MIIWGGALLGAAIGGFTARKRGGNALDMAQYAAGYALAFTTIGLILNVVMQRLGV